LLTPLEIFFLTLIIAAIFFLYPYLAIARIWFYAKQQTRILKDIRDSLARIEVSALRVPPRDG